MIKPGYVSTDKTGINKDAGAKEAMPGFEDFQTYETENKTAAYEPDLPPPKNLQDNPDIKASRPGANASTPDRYY